MDPFSLISFGLGTASTLLSGQAKRKAAAHAEAEANRVRERYEEQARSTQKTLGREIDTMRTLRDLDMPAYQQAAQVAATQRAAGYERQTRMQQLGKLPQQYRDAVFGGQLQQYIGREGQKIQRYSQMSQGIFDMASKAQAEVNQMLKAGGTESSSMMKTAQAMKYEAGDPLGQVLGAAAQGVSLYGKGVSARKQQDKTMAKQQDYDARQAMLHSDLSTSEFKERSAFMLSPEGRELHGMLSGKGN